MNYPTAPLERDLRQADGVSEANYPLCLLIPKPGQRSKGIYHEGTPLLKANAAKYEDTKLFVVFSCFPLFVFS